MNAAIAQHLNILESAIVKVEEWANVLFVVAKGIGARFVSKKVAKVEKQLISGLEYAEKLAALWNQTIGSEWHSKAAGFVKATLWMKKADEIRVYFGDGCFSLKQASNAEIVGGLQGFKYGIGDQVKALIAQLSQEFKCDRLKPKAQNVAWFNEDGQEVDSIDPDAVYSKETY